MAAKLTPKPVSRLAYSEDAELREHGFQIHARPPHGPPLWTRAGKVLTHAQARKKIVGEKEQREKAAAAGIEMEMGQ